MAKVSCQLCGKEFEAKRRDAKYCSECKPIKHKEYMRKVDAKRRFVGNCDVCGKPISRKAKRCEKCRFLAEKNPAWNGGRFKSPHGYIYIYSPDYPMLKQGTKPYMAEHRLVWEKVHNQLLPEGLIIHHLNGIKDDNRPENLVAIPKKQHSTRTRLDLAEERIRTLESQLKE